MPEETGDVELKEIVDAFERGKEALKSAEKFERLDLAVAANRIYIAGENLAYSLLLSTSGSAPKDHGKIWNAVQKLYEKGDLKSNYRPLLELSYRLRMKGDYGRDVGGLVEIKKEAIKAQIAGIREFASEAERVLKAKGILRPQAD